MNKSDRRAQYIEAAADAKTEVENHIVTNVGLDGITRRFIVKRRGFFDGKNWHASLAAHSKVWGVGRTPAGAVRSAELTAISHNF